MSLPLLPVVLLIMFLALFMGWGVSHHSDPPRRPTISRPAPRPSLPRPSSPPMARGWRAAPHGARAT
jgi:hypothetical protein